MLMLIFFLIHPYMNFWKLSLMLIFLSFLMMKMSLNIFFSNLTINMGCDIISYFLIYLSIFIISLSILSSNMYNFNIKFYFFLILVLLKILIFLFITFNLFMFYVLFEFSLIPMMLLILGWGMKIERLQASIYFMFYTMFSSLPFLYFLIYYMYLNYSNFMLSTIFFNLNNMLKKDFLFVFFFSFAFLVKMPIFLFHLWLPKAHVEAPVTGSMILAGILLKLGGYGLIRMMMIMLEYFYKYSSFFISFSIWGGFVISIFCLNQLDMKMIVAFSSISHMSLLIGSLFSTSLLGLYGAFLIMLGHGLTSSGLFMLVNVFYNRSYSRSLIFNKGLINISPNLTFCSFLIISSSMASPPSINLMSELIMTYSLIYYFYMFMIIIFFSFLMSVCYFMYLYSFSQYGKLFSGLYFFKNIYMIEYFIILMHWMPANLFIMKSEFLILFN